MVVGILAYHLSDAEHVRIYTALGIDSGKAYTPGRREVGM